MTFSESSPFISIELSGNSPTGQAPAAAGIDYADINVEILDCVTCPFCGKDLSSLTLHPMCVHEVLPQEVREEYPDQEFACEESPGAED